jgi:hypothetical protein
MTRLLGRKGVDGRMILKRLLVKRSDLLWTRFIRLLAGIGVGLL